MFAWVAIRVRRRMYRTRRRRSRPIARLRFEGELTHDVVIPRADAPWTYAYLTNPLTRGGNTLGELALQPPDGTTIYAYTDGGWQTARFLSRLGRWSNPTLSLPPGRGFIVAVPRVW
jgi:hypothetical protein